VYNITILNWKVRILEYHSSVIKVECQPKPLLKNIEARYYLKATLDNPYNDMITYIMMNPSIADLTKSDATVNRVIKFAHDQTNNDLNSLKVGVVSIVNLFGVYETDSTSLQSTLNIVMTNPSLYNQMIIDNRNKINEFISKSKYVVLAWGDIPSKMNATTHNEEVNKVYEALFNSRKLDSVYVLKSSSKHHITVLTKDKRPRHPNRFTPCEYVKCKNLMKKGNYLGIELN
jgi:hypothetical protein